MNANIDCEIYLEQPEGFVKFDKYGDQLVWKLKKFLYGLKEIGRKWYILLHGSLVEEGFEQYQSDHCVYQKIDENSTGMSWRYNYSCWWHWGIKFYIYDYVQEI